MDRNTSIGIFCALLAATAFSINDMAIKFLSGDYPLHEVVLVRATVGLLFTLAIFIPLEGGLKNLKTQRLPLHILRGLCVVLANMTFFLGLAAIPLSEATAIFFVSPIIITIFSVIFLKETVGLYRWLAVAAGLAGVLIMLRPGSSAFQYAALLPLIAATLYASVHMVTRVIGVTEKASTMAFYIQATFIVVCVIIGLAIGDGRYSGSSDPSLEFLLRPWVWPTNFDLFVMAGVGVASGVGGYTISQAYRLCEAALIAPYEYWSMVLAIVWGILIFSEWPDWISWLGIVLIFSAGLIVFWREAHLKRRNASQRVVPKRG